METLETLQQYYEMTCQKLPMDLQRGKGLTRHFNVFLRNNCYTTMPFRRRDYYKISLCKGNAVLYTEKGEVEINQPAIFFSNPIVKFGWKNISEEQQGYICIFNEVFVTPGLKREFRKLANLFKDDVYSFIPLTEPQYELLFNYFKIMKEEYNDCFVYKDEIIQNLIKVILLTAMKVRTAIHPVGGIEKQDVLVGRFLDLLDSQFPVDSPRHSIKLKTPGDFGEQLHIHINHLNHVVKTNTGKTTSQFILEKKIAEALSLLKNTDWTVSEISASLGFEYPQYFNIFFKRQTGRSPKAYRDSLQLNV